MKRLRSGASALYLVFKLIERLSTTWRRIDGYQTIALANENAAEYTACNGLRRPMPQGAWLKPALLDFYSANGLGQAPRPFVVPQAAGGAPSANVYPGIF